MVEFRVVSFSSTEIGGFIHGSGGDNTDGFVKEGVVYSFNLV